MIMKKRFDFGKIAYYGKRKENRVTVDVELRKRGGDDTFRIDPTTKERIYTGEKTPEYIELSICGYIWNRINTDCLSGGQNLDTINKYKESLSDRATFELIYDLWKNYHLNGMHAGTPEQEKALKEKHADGSRDDYTADCEYLKSIGLYEMPYYGLSVGQRWNGELYRYGSAWLIQEIPGDVLLKIEHLLNV